MKREPFTLKQKLLITFTAFVLYLPMLLIIIYYRDQFSPRKMAVIAGINLPIGVSLLALISEKWIRGMK
jgi:hypothetical protein